MDQINVEEFKRNIKGCLDRLPFAVTRRGKVLFVCYGPEDKLVDDVKKQSDMPESEIVVPVVSGGAEKPAVKPVIAPKSTNGGFFNPQPKGGTGGKQHKATAKLSPVAIVPEVAAIVSAKSWEPTVAHHPMCGCGVCRA